MTRFRITVRADEPTLELRGYTDLPPAVLNSLADALKPYGMVLASVADDDYDPFKENEYLRHAGDTYTIAELDGTEDEADWLKPGHVLDAQEVEWLRSRRIARD